MNHKRNLTQKGWTLIELLIVIAILGILTGISSYTLKGVKDQVWRLRCINNLREHGIAWYLYLEDHNECFPQYVEAPQDGKTDEFEFGGKQGRQGASQSARNRILNKYCEIDDESSPNIELFYCRADVNNIQGDDNHFDWHGNSYEVNKRIIQYKPSGGGGSQNYGSRPLSTITFPKDKVFLERDNPFSSKAHNSNSKSNSSSNNSNIDDVSLVVLFVDGHVAGPYSAISDFESENQSSTDKKILTYPNSTNDTGNL